MTAEFTFKLPEQHEPICQAGSRFGEPGSGLSSQLTFAGCADEDNILAWLLLATLIGYTALEYSVLVQEVAELQHQIKELQDKTAAHEAAIEALMKGQASTQEQLAKRQR